MPRPSISSLSRRGLRARRPGGAAKRGAERRSVLKFSSLRRRRARSEASSSSIPPLSTRSARPGRSRWPRRKRAEMAIEAADLRLCFVTDRALAYGRSLEAVIAAAARGGARRWCNCAKKRDDARLLEEARALKAPSSPRSALVADQRSARHRARRRRRRPARRQRYAGRRGAPLARAGQDHSAIDHRCWRNCSAQNIENDDYLGVSRSRSRPRRTPPRRLGGGRGGRGG